MFDCFFTAYKNEIYEEFHKFHLKKNIKENKGFAIKWVIFIILMIAFYVVAILCLKTIWIFIPIFLYCVCLIIFSRKVNKYLKKKAKEKGCKKFQNELKKIKQLLHDEAYKGLYSESGIQYLIDGCQEIKQNNKESKKLKDYFTDGLKVLVLPAAGSVFTISLYQEINLTVISFVIALIFTIFIVFLIYRFLIWISLLDNIDRKVAACLCDALKYIQLTIKEDSEITNRLIISGSI